MGPDTDSRPGRGLTNKTGAKTPVRIVSGGQTGVDRAALDAALAVGVPCGGWCPADRMAEDGELPTRYPLTPAPKPGYRERTIRNVLDSDGTILIYTARLSGGTEETLSLCMTLHRPYCLLDASELSAGRAGELAAAFVTARRMTAVNVAGPRLSRWADGYGYTRLAVAAMLDRLVPPPRDARGSRTEPS